MLLMAMRSAHEFWRDQGAKYPMFCMICYHHSGGTPAPHDARQWQCPSGSQFRHGSGVRVALAHLALPRAPTRPVTRTPCTRAFSVNMPNTYCRLRRLSPVPPSCAAAQTPT